MPQYLVTARDGTDADAPARRKAARPAHLPGVQEMARNGTLIVGGALLDDAGNAVGSVAVVDFPSRAELDAWLAHEPYVLERVWLSVDVVQMQIAVRAV